MIHLSFVHVLCYLLRSSPQHWLLGPKNCATFASDGALKPRTKGHGLENPGNMVVSQMIPIYSNWCARFHQSLSECFALTSRVQATKQLHRICSQNLWFYFCTRSWSWTNGASFWDTWGPVGRFNWVVGGVACWERNMSWAWVLWDPRPRSFWGQCGWLHDGFQTTRVPISFWWGHGNGWWTLLPSHPYNSWFYHSNLAVALGIFGEQGPAGPPGHDITQS